MFTFHSSLFSGRICLKRIIPVSYNYTKLQRTSFVGRLRECDMKNGVLFISFSLALLMFSYFFFLLQIIRNDHNIYSNAKILSMVSTYYRHEIKVIGKSKFFRFAVDDEINVKRVEFFFLGKNKGYRNRRMRN